MSHARISASSLERLAVCPCSIAMPHAAEASDAGARGTRLHLALEALVKGWPREMAAGLVATQEERDVVATVRWEDAAGDLAAQSRRPEAPYMLTFHADGPGILRAEKLPGGHGRRSYPFGERFQIAGTVDVVGWTTWDNRLVVIDWKTGGDVVEVKANAQLRFAAVAAAMTEQQEFGDVEARIAYVSSDGRVRVDKATFDRYELREAADDLEDICKTATRAHEGRHLPLSSMQLRPSPICRHCPALRSCPAMVGAARHLLATAPPSQEVMVEKLRAMTLPELTMAYQRKELLAHWLKRMDGAFEALASVEPIPVGDGYELRAETSTRRSLPLAAICDLARSKGATDDEIEALRVTSTTASVRVCRMPGAQRGRKRPEAILVPDD
jgi:hypothetical protein